MPLLPKSALHKYQDQSIEHLYDRNSALGLLPVGAGKTVIGWTAAVELMDDGFVQRPIVFGPRLVAINEWPGQREDWEHLKDREIVNWSGEPASWPDSIWKRSRLLWGQRTHAERRLPNIDKTLTAKNDKLRAERHDLATSVWAGRHARRGKPTLIRQVRNEIIRQQNKGIPLKPNELRAKIRNETELVEQLIAGLKPLEAATNKEILKTEHPKVLHVTSYENIEWFCDLYPVGKGPFDLWIFDEIGKLKNPKSPRYKMVSKRTKKVLSDGGIVWGLNATPAPEGLLDLFTQVKIVDGGKLWGDSFYKWRQKYFTPADFQGYDWRPQMGAKKLLLEELNTLAFRVDESDLSYIKTMMHSQIKVDLPAKARAAYEEMKKEMELVLAGLRPGATPDDTIVALSAAAASTKLRQITQGFIYDEKGRPTIIHEEKAHALADLIDEMSGNPMLIAYEFKEDLEAIRKVWKNVPFIGSGVSASSVKQHIEGWNSGKLKILAVHPQSAGHGLNLQKGPGAHICWYALPWALELFLQMNGRIDRQGQTRATFGHHIVVKNSMDQRVSDALMMKDAEQRSIIEAIRRL